MHSQNGTTFVPVVRWENVGVELTSGGRHVGGLTKRHLAPRVIVINEITRWDWMGQARCGESGANDRSNRSGSRRDECGIKETEAVYNHDHASSFGDLPARKVRGLARGLIVAAETRWKCVLMCLMMGAKRESGHEDTVRQRCVGWHCGLGRFTRRGDKGRVVDQVGRFGLTV